ncbi:hypothetical protein [Nocardia sp. NPDC019395]|uniref:hypothetical protein n=1 Tax=Nocardia sp. NPDC019395 TaxID=3154686 RepID=UPI0033CBBFA9
MDDGEPGGGRLRSSRGPAVAGTVRRRGCTPQQARKADKAGLMGSVIGEQCDQRQEEIQE